LKTVRNLSFRGCIRRPLGDPPKPTVPPYAIDDVEAGLYYLTGSGNPACMGPGECEGGQHLTALLDHVGIYKSPTPWVSET
jgi:hypothetical protein